MSLRFSKTLITAFSLLALSACASLERSVHTPPEIPAASIIWSDYLMANDIRSDSVQTKWWEAFNDPVLNGLIEMAASDNLDIALAGERIKEARLLAQRDDAGLKPRMDLGGSVTGQRLSETSTLPAGRVPGFETENVIFYAGFDASWELDLFGRGAVTKDLGAARIAAARDARSDAILVVIAEIARHYISLRAAQAEIEIVESNIKRQSEIITLTKIKRDYGEASDFDVERTELLKKEYDAQLPAQYRNLQTAKTSLAVLTGAPPSTDMSRLDVSGALPQPPVIIAAGVTSDLLRRRPDIRRAEQDYAIAAHQADITRLSTYPRFSLFGSGGPETTSLTDLMDLDSLTLSLGALVNWSLYDGGRQQVDEALSQSNLTQTEITYRKTVFDALEEVELAVARYANTSQSVRQRRDIIQSRRRITQMSKERYEAGTGGLIDVLDSERDLADAELQFSRATADQMTQLVSLYKAIGGGWQAYTDPSNL